MPDVDELLLLEEHDAPITVRCPSSSWRSTTINAGGYLIAATRAIADEDDGA